MEKTPIGTRATLAAVDTVAPSVSGVGFSLRKNLIRTTEEFHRYVVFFGVFTGGTDPTADIVPFLRYGADWVPGSLVTLRGTPTADGGMLTEPIPTGGADEIVLFYKANTGTPTNLTLKAFGVDEVQ